MNRIQRSSMLGKFGERRAPTRDPKPRIIIFSEGDVTERMYFEGLAKLVGNRLVEIQVVGGRGATVKLVGAAIAHKGLLDVAAMKSLDSFENQFEVWAVMDVDEHPKLPEAQSLAKKNSVRLGLSNPCFELWLLYHCEDCNKPWDRHELQKYLSKKVKSYNHKSGKKIEFSDVAKGLGQAMKLAKQGLKRRIEERSPNGNPSSTVVNLVERIVSLGKYKA